MQLISKPIKVALMVVALVTFPWPGLFPGLSWLAEADPPYQGFGATTPGGTGGTIVHVTNLSASGPGSLRDAVSQGNRTVVFDVGGTIVLDLYDDIILRNAYITIDGFTAPPPGITLTGAGLFIRGNKGAHDIIVRGIRVRDVWNDGIQLKHGAYNVVIDRVSIDGAGDGSLDITGDSHDVTVSWSIIGEPIATHPKSTLIKYNPSRVTLHHNIFTANQRNPQVGIQDPETFVAPATDTTLDMRNNIVWGWGNGYGTLVFYGAWANVVDNFYSSGGGDVQDALIVCEGDCVNTRQVTTGGDPNSYAWAYVAGNVSGDGYSAINDEGNQTVPFPAPPVDTEGPCTAAQAVVADAGVRPLDLIDQQYVSAISLANCALPLSVTITQPATAVTLIEGESQAFSGSASGGEPPYTYSWTFPGADTTTGSGAGPHTRTYAVAGSYTATLTVTDSTGATDSASVQITVETLPLVPVCGDGTIDAGEECDDGNVVDGDGCSATCLLEVPPSGGPNCDDGPVTTGCTVNGVVGSACIGTPGHDTIIGTPGADVILGLGGHDLIFGAGGDDFICGGEGSDSITTEDGVDMLDGGAGHNTLKAGAGDDLLLGGTGSDNMDGEAGDDVIGAGDGHNTVQGGAGQDIITSGTGNDSIDGGAGTDACAAGSGYNFIVNCEI